MARTEVAPTAVRRGMGRLSWSVVPVVAGAATAAVAASGWAATRRELARSERALHAERVDELTELWTRRVWQTIARQRVAAPERELWVALVDVDDLKPVNDRLGHQAGDQVLATEAARLTSTLSTPAVTGRLGGDEFGLLLAQPPAGWLRQLDEQLAQPVQLRDSSGQPGPWVPARASIGAVPVPPGGSDLGGLLAEADARMYAVKNSRRRCSAPGDGGVAGRADGTEPCHVPAPRPRGVADLRRMVRHPTPG